MIQEKALALLRNQNPYGVPLENHCIRLAEFTLALAHQEEVDHDADTVWAAAYLHDIGLMVPMDRTTNYLQRGVAFSSPYLVEWGLDGAEQAEMNKLLLFNHSLRSVGHISPMAEVMRCAVQVEHSFGAWSHGLAKEERKKIFHAHPRSGLSAVLFDFFKISLRRDGPVEIFRYFYPSLNEDAWQKTS